MRNGSVDVAIVGAGIAGLAAARWLHEAGLGFVVLESRERLGGRLATVEDSRGNVHDIGATWVWPAERHVGELLAQLGLQTHPQHLDGDAMYQDAEGLQRLDGNPLDVPSNRIIGGAQKLAIEIAAQLPEGSIQLERPVIGLESGASAVTVKSESGEFAAQQVILAAPPALVVERVRFTPPLDARLASLASVTPVWMGATTKVVACYQTPFWRDADLSGSAISHLGPMHEMHDMSGPGGNPAAIFGFVSGIGRAGTTVLPERIVAQLVEVFGPEASEPYDVLIHDWRTETWTSPSDVAGQNSYQTYGHPIYQETFWDGRVSWASTETSTQNPGHIDGGLAAAKRAASRVIQALT